MSNDVSQNLKAFLQADSSVRNIAADRIYEDKVPQAANTSAPFIWFATRQENPATNLNGDVGELPDSVLFDLECVGMDKNRAKDLARLSRAILNNYRGAFGDSTTKGISVRDKDSDYIPVNGDRGQYVAAFDVEVWL